MTIAVSVQAREASFFVLFERLDTEPSIPLAWALTWDGGRRCTTSDSQSGVGQGMYYQCEPKWGGAEDVLSSES